MVSGTSRYIEGSLVRTLPQQQVQTRREARPAVKRRPMAAIALTAVLCVALGLAFLAQSAVTARLAYQNARLDQQIRELQRENSELELRAEQLGSLERIERVATESLGMVRPRESGIWNLTDK